MEEADLKPSSTKSTFQWLLYIPADKRELLRQWSKAHAYPIPATIPPDGDVCFSLGRMTTLPEQAFNDLPTGVMVVRSALPAMMSKSKL